MRITQITYQETFPTMQFANQRLGVEAGKKNLEMDIK